MSAPAILFNEVASVFLQNDVPPNLLPSEAALSAFENDSIFMDSGENSSVLSQCSKNMVSFYPDDQSVPVITESEGEKSEDASTVHVESTVKRNNSGRKRNHRNVDVTVVHFLLIYLFYLHIKKFSSKNEIIKL